MSLRLRTLSVNPTSPANPENDTAGKQTRFDLGNGSEVLYVPRFLPSDKSWELFDYLDSHIPWTRPTIRVFGRSCVQPRDTCYVASAGLPDLVYSGYSPRAYLWDEFPPLKEILEMVHKALPGNRFNSLLLNRYKGGNDYVGWHSDDEKLYGSAPEIASVSFGCEREFFLKKKPSKISHDSFEQLFEPMASLQAREQGRTLIQISDHSC
ncbi:DNA oxidative demethylase ALKBH2 isoform X3 [Punica granatum]|uniref:DNA oxidative demethylase ALKBH2 isoform X3 n=1 Tax=Punica granatum TaxID=22663 RepID=A0A6P8DLW3_PUNGR|nr:DNA oxidative demethylase ALKBH2 isoform X3 [Punica granatum]